MTKRAHISLKTKLASALLALGHIPYDDAKQISEDQILSLYNFDHGILHAIDANNEFWNLTPVLIRPHREKSRQDTSIVAKVKRNENTQADFHRRILAKSNGQKPERGKWPSRPWPTQQRNFR